MDKWNRKDQNEYTGITAQRRNRRRTGGEPAQRPEMPPRPVPRDYSAWRRPVTPVKAEESAEPEELPETEVPAEYTAPEEPTGPAVPEEPTEPAEEEKPEKTAEPAVPEESETAEKPAGQETPAEEPYAAQGPDSRVPPEARRMAASPYGAAGAGRRPAVQPQAAQGRTSLPEERQTPVRPWRDRPGEGTARPGNRAPGNQQKSRVRVGYAPGRMSDDMTQHVPVREAGREQMYGRDAKAYLEKRQLTFKTEENGGKNQHRTEHDTLRAVVVMLLLIGAVLTVILVQRNGGSPKRKIPREAPQVISFESPQTTGLTAPVDLAFTAETDKTIDGIRLRGENNMDLDTVATYADNADGKHWIMKMHVETGFTGTVMLQVRMSGEGEWYDTDRTVEVEVSSLPGADVTETPAPVMTDPDDEDYYNPDEPEIAEKGGTEPNLELIGKLEEPEADQPEEQEEVPETDVYAEDDLPAGELKTPRPTDTPAPVTPEPTATPPLTAEAAPEANPDIITGRTVWTSFTKKEKDYNRAAKELIKMPAADEYSKRPLGVLTFRGDNFRRNAVIGTMSSAPKELRVLWQAEAGSARGTNQTYYGYGWTGQPVIARWSTEVRTHSNITESKLEKKALKEVIIAGMDGVIRFLDLEDGKITRNSIKLGYPMRGTPSLHPRGYPFMTVGQFARKMKVKTGKIGLRQYNLFTQGELKLIDGLDGKYHRPLNNVGSFETSALIDRESDTLIAIGSNGVLYLESLGSTFDYNTGVMTISPSTVVMTSKVKGQKNTALLAVESSPAVYDKYVFYADMGGVLRCVDTNTLTPVWAVETGDSVMAAIAMDLTEERELNLYTANMLNNRKKGDSNIQIRRYDALSGREIWTTDVGVFKGKKDKTKDNVGAKASPVIGQNALNGLVYFTVTGLSEEGRERLKLGNEEAAALIALEKETGKVVWAFGLESRSESSPIALYDDSGNGWILQCEQKGIVHLVDGLTGSEVSSLDLEAEIEASPAAYNNVVVIGTTGKGTTFVYAIEVKLENGPESGAAEQPEEAGAEPEQAENADELPEEAEEEPAWPEEEPEEEPEWPEEDEVENEEDSGGA